MRGASFRRALLASVGVHVALAIGLVLLVRWQANQPQAASLVPTIDTRADVRLEFASEEPTATVEVRPTPMELPATAAPSISQPSASSGPPLAKAIAIPLSLPRELIELLKKPVANGSVQPAEATVPRATAGPAWVAGGSPVHGALDPKQSIVYVLDASGSMGEWGKFDAARGALIATLRLQPESVRFQIVIYSGSASLPLRGAPGECLPATTGNIDRAISALESLGSPTGRSIHLEGLRAALNIRPNLVLIFTDADDLPATAFRGVLRQAAKPATICVAKVAATGVGTPAEMK